MMVIFHQVILAGVTNDNWLLLLVQFSDSSLTLSKLPLSPNN
jgi:hypothetical protein